MGKPEWTSHAHQRSGVGSAYRLSAGVPRPHIHHVKRSSFSRAFDGHVDEIDRQMSFGGDLPHRQSCRNIADDTCNDIALTIVLRADRT